jgi:hypothetical protein
MVSSGVPVPPDKTFCMEQFGFAYVEAVASVAGCAVTIPQVDLQSEDLVLRQPAEDGRPVDYRLAVQVKTNAGEVVSGDDLSYRLPVKNYKDLCIPRAELIIPRILVVVRVPKAVEDWLDQSDKELAVRHCAYWVSIAGEPEPDTSSTKTVRIPQSQRFNPSSLERMMKTVAGGGTL